MNELIRRLTRELGITKQQAMNSHVAGSPIDRPVATAAHHGPLPKTTQYSAINATSDSTRSVGRFNHSLGKAGPERNPGGDMVHGRNGRKP